MPRARRCGRDSVDLSESANEYEDLRVGVALRPPPSLRLARTAVLGVSAVALCISAVALTLSSEAPGDHVRAAVLHGLIVAIPIGVGIWATTRSMYKRFGRLLIASGCVWSLATLAESDDSALYSVGRIAGWLVVVLVLYLMLAFPSGRLVERLDRVLMVGVSATLCLLYLPTVLLVDEYPRQTPWALCRSDCPANWFQVVAHEPAITGAIVPTREVITFVLAIAVTGALVRRTLRASRLERQTLAPVAVAALILLVCMCAFLALRRLAPGSPAGDTVGWLYGLAIPTVALGFLVGLVRWQLFVATALRGLSAELGTHGDTAALAATLRTTLHDPTLKLLRWDTGTAQWVDSSGAPLDLARARAQGRAVTEAHDPDGRPTAALVADPALLEEPELRDALMTYAVAGLENRRLEMRLRDALHQLEDSRARAATAASSERERIERDLHDGAQQRLIAVVIRLGLAADEMQRDPGAGARLVRELSDEVELALAEVRHLAHGGPPSLLAERGLGDALRVAARDAALPANVASDGVGRYSPEVESAVYFTCLEAMQNAAKHARGATRVAISLRADHDLHFEIADDGAGLSASYQAGAGMTNMRARIAAVGGSLTLQSPRGHGTRVSGTIPLARQPPTD